MYDFYVAQKLFFCLIQQFCIDSSSFLLQRYHYFDHKNTHLAISLFMTHTYKYREVSHSVKFFVLMIVSLRMPHMIVHISCLEIPVQFSAVPQRLELAQEGCQLQPSNLLEIRPHYIICVLSRAEDELVIQKSVISSDTKHFSFCRVRPTSAFCAQPQIILPVSLITCSIASEAALFTKLSCNYYEICAFFSTRVHDC